MEAVKIVSLFLAAFKTEALVIALRLQGFSKMEVLAISFIVEIIMTLLYFYAKEIISFGFMNFKKFLKIRARTKKSEIRALKIREWLTDQHPLILILTLVVLAAIPVLGITFPVAIILAKVSPGYEGWRGWKFIQIGSILKLLLVWSFVYLF